MKKNCKKVIAIAIGILVLVLLFVILRNYLKELTNNIFGPGVIQHVPITGQK